MGGDRLADCDNFGHVLGDDDLIWTQVGVGGDDSPACEIGTLA